MVPYPKQVMNLFPNEGEHPLYNIPMYQREYAWTTSECEKLFDDLYDNDERHFLGSIICVDRKTDDGNNIDYEVIDGQQRLTTLSILLLAIFAELRKRESQFGDDEKVEILNLKRRIITKKGNLRLTLQTQNNNAEDYKSILHENGFEVSYDATLKNVGNRKIKRNFTYFVKRLDGLLADKEENSVEILFAFLQKVYAAELILIANENNSSAYKLFESLNNRGIPLSAIDLLKNLLLSSANGKEKQTIDDYFSYWQNILAYTDNDPSTQERFLRHNYNAFRKAYNKPFIKDGSSEYPLGTVATQSKILPIYERLITNEPYDFIVDLQKKAQKYARVISNENIDDDIVSEDLRNKYLRLNHLGAAPSHMLLLFLECNREKLGLNDSDIGNVVELLISFFLRRNLNDKPATRDLDRMMISIADDILKVDANKSVYRQIYDSLIPSLSDDTFDGEQHFANNLLQGIYDKNYGITRFLLADLSEAKQSKESKVDLWEKDEKGRYIWTVEHIFPQGGKITKDWIDMIADGNENEAKRIREEHVHKLGNLTITAYNGNLSDSSFSKKKNLKKEDKRIGYNNGLYLNEDVYSEDKWTESKIIKRTQRLKEEILKHFEIKSD